MKKKILPILGAFLIAGCATTSNPPITDSEVKTKQEYSIEQTATYTEKHGDLELYVKDPDNGVVMVCNKKGMANYVGDEFYNYRLTNSGTWEKWKVTSTKNGPQGQKIGTVSQLDLPVYVNGVISLYHDVDPGEENIVCVFTGEPEPKMKKFWIDMAKEHIKTLYQKNKNTSP